MKLHKKIVYIDMDNVLVDFPSAFPKLSKSTLQEYDGRLDEVPGIFSIMEPMPRAIEAYTEISSRYDTYILSTSPWNNPSAWADKLEWVKAYLLPDAYKRLILTHHKNLNMGDYLIDDRLKNGVESFSGKHIHFGADDFPDWNSVLAFLL